MKVELFAWTPAADVVCGRAAALCTGFKGFPEKALNGALASGHESVAEHANFTFCIEGVSRVLLAQLTRHRLASFSVQSQRYCGVDTESVVIPESIKEKRFTGSVMMLLRKAADLYSAMVSSGIPEEDARFFVPQGVTTTLMMTMNARELRHFFSLRCCNRAQWEIRKLADEMLAQCREVAPILFDDTGCACMRGEPCPEKRPCGKPRKTAS